MADKVANYSVKIDSNGKTVGDEAADALARLKATIEGSQSALKDYSQSLRSLRGSSEEIKSAKESLRAKIDAERNAISAANLAILKQGSSYAKLAEETKKAEAAQKKLSEQTAAKELERAKQQSEAFGKGLGQVGGPLGGILGRFQQLKDAISGAGGGMGVAALGAGALAGAFVLLASGALSLASRIVDLTGSLLRWIVVSADAARAAALEREAWTGSAQQAMALGHQIDALAAKVPTAKAELQKLSGELIRTFAQSYVGGQGIVDTFNVIATASAAMGDQVGNQLGDIIKRAKDIGRVQIQPLDLRGTTIALKDVAAELAKSMKISVAQAEAALRGGGVKVDAAAAALRAAVEKRFGPINAKKMLSLDALKQRFSDVLGSLTKDVNLEPLLVGLSKIVSMFDASTVAGAALKNLIDQVSKVLGPAFQKLAPIATEAFVRIEIQAYRVGLALLDVRDRMRQAFAGKGLDDILTTENAIKGVSAAIQAFGTLAVGQIKGIATIVIALGTAFLAVRDALNTVKTAFGNWYETGKHLVEGLVQGITDGITSAKNAIVNLADQVTSAFTAKTEIHSPSALYHRFGQDGIDRGLEEGIDAGAPNVQAAADRMAPTPPAGGARVGGNSATAAAPLTFHFYVDARGASAGTADRLANPDFTTQLIQAFEGALKTQGIPVQIAKVSA